LMISASHDRQMFDQAMRSGANAYLAKPFDSKELIQVCDRLFRCLTAIPVPPDPPPKS